MNRIASVLWHSLFVLSLAGCQGGVVHPEPGKPNDAAYCRASEPTEDNCMACTSKPGCGYCITPDAGNVSCQPGASHESPAGCTDGWVFSSAECAEPPPPPPPAEGG
jgi:hypothetical protein